MEMVKRGQRVLTVHSGSMGQSLFTGSLVGGSLFKSASIVTALAGNLSTDPNRRVTETALIIAHLMFVGSLIPGGKAWESLVRVRLLHSALRYWLPSSGRYNMEKMNNEIPINQHDMSITLGLFGYVNLRSIRRLNIILTKDENESFIHMWKYSGYILGIIDELLPNTLEDQEELFIASLKLSASPEWIPEQTRYVLDEMARKINEDTIIIPQSWAQDYLYQLTRYLSGTEYIIGMKIEDKGDNHWTLILARLLGRIETGFKWYFPFGESIMNTININLISRMIKQHQNKEGSKLGAGMREAPSAYTKYGSSSSTTTTTSSSSSSSASSPTSSSISPSSTSSLSPTSSTTQSSQSLPSDHPFAGLSSSSTCPMMGLGSSSSTSTISSSPLSTTNTSKL